MPPPATTVWEFTYPAPTDGLDFSQGAGPHSTPLIVGNRIYATSTQEGALRARQGDRQATLVARLHEGVRLAVAGARLRLQPASLQRHDHRQRRRTRARDGRVQSGDRRAGLEGGRFRRVAGVADAHRCRRPAAARRLCRRPRGRRRPRQRPCVLARGAQDRLGPEHQHAGLVAGRSSVVRVVSLQHRQPGDRAAPGGRHDGSGREVVQQPHARAHRHDHPPRRPCRTRRAATSGPRS